MDSHGYEILMILLSKVQVALATFVAALISMLFAVFTESAMMILLAYGMLLLHILSGWLVMWKYRTGWNEEKWFRSIMKFLFFGITILSTRAIKNVHGIEVPIASFIAGLLTFNEFRGFIKNGGRLMGIDVWTVIADQVDWQKIFGKIKKQE